MFDVWFNGKAVKPVILQQLETKLQGAFNLPATHAVVLVNGKPHRIKCGSRTDEAQKLADQFASWGEKVRVEAIGHAAESSTNDFAPSPDENVPVGSLTLAAAGETIPTQPRDMTPPSISADHLHLWDH